MADARRSLAFAFLGEDRSLGKTLNRVSGQAEHAHGALSRLNKIAIGAGAVAGLTLIAKKLADVGHDTVNAYTGAARAAQGLQRIIGGTVEDASRLQHAAAETGVSEESLGKSLRILSKNLQAASKDVTKKTTTHHLEIQTVAKLVKGHIVYVKALRNVTDVTTRVVKVSKDLGFAYHDSHGQLLPMSKLLPNIADHFAKMPNGVAKTALALKLFGRAGTDMLPLLNKGRGGIAELMAEADKLGVTMSGKDVKAVKAYTLEHRHFEASMHGLKITLGRELFPIFTAWARSLDQNAPKIIAWARKHLPEFRHVAGDVAGFITGKLAPAVSKLVDGFVKGTGPGGGFRDALAGVVDAGKTFGSVVLPPLKWLEQHPDLFKEVAKDAAILAGVLKAKSWLTGLGLLKSAGGVKLPGVGGALGGAAASLKTPLPVFVTNEGFGGGPGAPGAPGGRGTGGTPIPPVEKKPPGKFRRAVNSGPGAAAVSVLDTVLVPQAAKSLKTTVFPLKFNISVNNAAKDFLAKLQSGSTDNATRAILQKHADAVFAGVAASAKTGSTKLLRQALLDTDADLQAHNKQILAERAKDTKRLDDLILGPLAKIPGRADNAGKHLSTALGSKLTTAAVRARDRMEELHTSIQRLPDAKPKVTLVGAPQAYDWAARIGLRLGAVGKEHPTPTVQVRGLSESRADLAELHRSLRTIPRHIPVMVDVKVTGTNALGAINRNEQHMDPEKRSATGGFISGPGTSTSDSIPVRLSRGEFVVNAAATRQNLTALQAMNAGQPSSVTHHETNITIENVHGLTLSQVLAEADRKKRIAALAGRVD